MNHSLARGADADMNLRRVARLDLGTFLTRAAQRLRRAMAAFGGLEIITRDDVADREAVLADARAEAALWKARARTLEARAQQLADDVADSQRVAMDLRARIVCLHGKLATAAATARYQSFTTALEGRTPDP